VAVAHEAAAAAAAAAVEAVCSSVPLPAVPGATESAVGETVAPQSSANSFAFSAPYDVPADDTPGMGGAETNADVAGSKRPQPPMVDDDDAAQDCSQRPRLEDAESHALDTLGNAVDSGRGGVSNGSSLSHCDSSLNPSSAQLLEKFIGLASCLAMRSKALSSGMAASEPALSSSATTQLSIVEKLFHLLSDANARKLGRIDTALSDLSTAINAEP